jgi:hypothetical protein
MFHDAEGSHAHRLNERIQVKSPLEGQNSFTRWSSVVRMPPEANEVLVFQPD